MTRTTYALGLGSNRPSRYGPPARALDAAVAVLEAEDVRVLARSPTIATPAMGGAGRAFANAALLVETDLPPPELMSLLQAIERAFGRRPGRRWGPRVLDLDILLMTCPGAGRGPGQVGPAGARAGRSVQRLAGHGGRGRGALGPGLRRGAPTIPHPGLARREFVLAPLSRIASEWRDPRSNLAVRHLRARLRRARPVDPSAAAA